MCNEGGLVGFLMRLFPVARRLFLRLMAPQEPGVLADCLLFMVRAGSWLTEFISKEAGVAIDSSEHESSAQRLTGVSKASLLLWLRCPRPCLRGTTLRLP